jgi:hypothetical protein
MRIPFIGATVICLAISTAAAAQPSPDAKTPVQPKSGEWVHTTDGAAIGRIEYVDRAKDGAPTDVGVIYGMRIVHIPADSLSGDGKGLVTNLTKAQVAKLN